MATKVKKWDKIFNVVYSIGASIVILGVVGKLAHTSWGDYALYLGLIVEAAIFFVSAFDTPASDYPWERVYPELIEDKPLENRLYPSVKRENASTFNAWDKTLQEIQIDPGLSGRLRTGIEQLGKTAETLSKNAEAILSSEKYETQLSEAAQHLTAINTAYKNQSELSQRQLELNKSMLDQLTQTIEDAKQFNTQMHALSNKLAALNKIYSGMLSAMNSKPAV